MRPKSIGLLALALGCGLLASIGITQVLAKRNAEPVETVLEMENVFVATQDIPQGEPLNQQLVKLEPWPKDKVPPNALVKGDEPEQYITKSKFYSGEPLIKKKLHAKGDKSDNAVDNIPKGMRIVSVRVDNVSGTANLIDPGNRVDLLCHFQPNPTIGITVPTTRTILQNIKVFAVDAVISSEKMDDGKPAQARTVTLLVTPEQAQKVTLATELGTVRLVLRPTDDSADVTTVPLTGTSLFDGNAESNKPEKELVQTDDGKSTATPEFLQFLEKSLKPAASGQATPTVTESAEQFKVRRLTGEKYFEVIFEKSRAPDGTEVWKQAGENDLSSGVTPSMPAAVVPVPAPTPTPDPPPRKMSRPPGGPARN